jgi:predicted RNase H-like HicB family nuclease
MKTNTFRFSAYLIKEDNCYVAICADLDVVTEGSTRAQAKKNLAEAVVLYIETAIESNLPVLRPIPADIDIGLTHPEEVLERFPLYIDCKVEAYA